MRVLATLTPQDVDPTAPAFDYAGFTPRQAVRAIVFDGNNVALLKVGAHNYYMLPGGGIDDGEQPLHALTREIREELGCTTTVTGEIGAAIMYNDRWKVCQTDSCFRAQLTGTLTRHSPTTFELEEGHQLVWTASLHEAIRLMESAAPKNRDGKLVRARDLIFLRAAQG